MDLTPSQVAAAQFRTVRKGYDPDEVESFLQRASKALEEAQQQATAMEARARAAVARLQEVSSGASGPPPPPATGTTSTTTDKPTTDESSPTIRRLTQERVRRRWSSPQPR